MSAPDGTGTRVVVHLAGPSDLRTVDALARLALLGRRLGWQLEVRSSGSDLEPLLALAGLADVLPVLPED